MLKWVKASERLPDTYNKLFIKVKGEPMIGKYIPEYLSFADKAGDLFSPAFVEWLDETPDAEGQATNTESDERIKQLYEELKRRGNELISERLKTMKLEKQLQATNNNVAEGERKIYVDEISTAAKMYKGGEIILAKLVEEINELLK